MRSQSCHVLASTTAPSGGGAGLGIPGRTLWRSAGRRPRRWCRMAVLDSLGWGPGTLEVARELSPAGDRRPEPPEESERFAWQSVDFWRIPGPSVTRTRPNSRTTICITTRDISAIFEEAILLEKNHRAHRLAQEQGERCRLAKSYRPPALMMAAASAAAAAADPGPVARSTSPGSQ
jgi:hypothetical protein